MNTWVNAWRENYADVDEEESNQWKTGFDQYAWAEEGNSIAESIEAEAPGYQVNRGFLSYLRKG